MWLVPAFSALAATPADVQSDLHDLLTVLERVHPALDRHVSRETLDRVVSAAVRELTEGSGEEVSPREAVRAVASVCAAVGDGHLEVGWPAAPVGPVLLPVYPQWVGDRVIVVAAVNPQLVGRELAEINRAPMTTLRDRVLPLIAVDGSRAEARQTALSADPWRFLHLEVPPAEVFTLTFADGETVEVAGISAAEVRALKGSRETAWEHDNHRTILRLPTFGGNGATFEAVVEAGFAVLSTEELVLDLRGNAGGFRDQGARVVGHLVDAPFAQWSSARLAVAPLPKRLRRQIRVPFGLPSEPTLALLRDGAGWTRPGDPGAAFLIPRAPRYAGPVTIWVDGATESAAVEMVVSLQQVRPDVTVVGEPTGGACDGHFGEQPIVFETPRLGVPVLISLQDITLVPTPGCVPGAGIQPDVPVTWTVAGRLGGPDPWRVATDRAATAGGD